MLNLWERKLDILVLRRASRALDGDDEGGGDGDDYGTDDGGGGTSNGVDVTW